MITQERLKELLRYEPDTGKFYWLGGRRGGNTAAGKPAGAITRNGYVRIASGGKAYLAHRLAWLYVNGELPEVSVDHINNNTTDNRICDLRLATFSENQYNRRVAKNNKSGIKGLSKQNERNGNAYWRAGVKCKDGYYFKLFPYTEEGKLQAAEWLEAKRNEKHGKYAKHN